jgi:GntR family transcriptional regulator
MGKLKISVDFRTGTPIYVQIMDQVRHQIATAHLQPGDQLPTVRQLAADLRVNFNTIARAYRLLDEAGIISTQHGRGTYILAPRSEERIERMRRDDLIRLTEQYLNAVHHLGFEPQDIRNTIEEHIREWDENGKPPSEKNL